MTDPVVEAAQRATDGRVSHLGGPGRYALRGAREMAEPIRELHTPKTQYYGHNQLVICRECHRPYPCETAKRVFSSEELER